MLSAEEEDLHDLGNALPIVAKQGTPLARGASVSVASIPEHLRDARFFRAYALARHTATAIRLAREPQPCAGARCCARAFSHIALPPDVVLHVVRMLAYPLDRPRSSVVHCLPRAAAVDEHTRATCRAMLGSAAALHWLLDRGEDATRLVRHAPRAALASARVLADEAAFLELMRVLGRSGCEVPVDIAFFERDEAVMRRALAALPRLPMLVPDGAIASLRAAPWRLRLFVRHAPMVVHRFGRRVALVARAVRLEPRVLDHLPRADPLCRRAVRHALRGRPAHHAAIRAWLGAPAAGPDRTAPAAPPPSDDDVRRDPWRVRGTALVVAEPRAALAIAKRLPVHDVLCHVAAELLRSPEWLGEAAAFCGAETAVFAYARIPARAVPKLYLSRAAIRWQHAVRAVSIALFVARLPYRAVFDIAGRAQLVGRAAHRGRAEAMRLLADVGA